MTKHRIIRFVWFLFFLSLALSHLGCAAPYELIPSSYLPPSSSVLPTSAQLERDKALYAIPPDLRAKLNAAMAQWGARAENVGVARRYMAQMPNPIRTMQQELLKTVLDWAAGESPDQRLETLEERRKKLDEALPLPHLEDPALQLGGGAFAGGTIGAVPLGPIAADVAIELKVLPKGTYWARVGRTCGEFISGVAQIVVGCEGMAAGVGMSSTGGGAVVGAPLIAGSFAIAVNGGATLLNAGAHAAELWDEGPPSQAPPPEPEVKLLQPKPKPVPQEPVAAAPPPAAKPPQAAPPAAKPAAPTAKPTASQAPPAVPETRTTTRNKATGETTTKTGTSWTTTRDKGKPPASTQPEPPQLSRGKRAHREEPVLPGEKAETPTPSGKRMDRYDAETAHIREIKPANPRAIRQGEKQVEGYRREMEQATGKPHTAEVSPYDPKKYE